VSSTPVKKLGEVATIDGESVRPEQLRASDVYVGLENIGSDGQLINLGSVAATDLRSNKYRFDTTHVLFGKLRPYLAKVARPTHPGVCSTDIITVAPSAELDRDYLFHWLRSPRVITEATEKSTGATLPRISPQALREFEIPVPPLDEQKRIAAKLDDLASTVSTYDECLGHSLPLLEDLYAAECRNVLGEVSGATIEVDLGSVLELIIDHRGKTPKKLGGDFVDEGIRVVSAIHIKDETIKWEERHRFVTEEMFERWMPEKIKTGDVLLTSEAPLGQLARVTSDDPIVLSQRLFALRANERKITGDFLFEFLLSVSGQERLQARATGATAVGIRQSELVKIQIPLPELDAQRTAASQLKELREGMKVGRSLLSQRRLKAVELRQSILEAAFRGDL
jgi:type I restriction enzyme S subunit